MSDSILDMVDAHLAKKMRLTKREFFGSSNARDTFKYI